MGRAESACHSADVGRKKKSTRPVKADRGEGSQGQGADKAAELRKETFCGRGDSHTVLGEQVAIGAEVAGRQRRGTVHDRRVLSEGKGNSGRGLLGVNGAGLVQKNEMTPIETQQAPLRTETTKC